MFIRDRKDQVDIIFEYLLNKRRKYDGNTLVQLAVKFESPEVLELFLSSPKRWKADFKSRNKDGLAAIHMSVRQRSEATFNIIAKNMPQLVIPVGLLYAQATTANISMYDDTLTLIAASPGPED